MRLALLLLSAVAAAPAFAQSTPLAVSVDCPGLDAEDGCDTAFFQTETPWVRFVRDPADADAAVLVVGQRTGAGGRRYEVSVRGRRGVQAARRDTLVAFAEPGATEDARRRVLLGRLHLALVPFVAATPLADAIRVTVTAPPADAPPPPLARDPWRGWTFTTSLGGFYSGEQRVSQGNLRLSGGASRVTDRTKYSVRVFGNESWGRFELSDSTIVTSANRAIGGFGVAVWSLSPRAAAGIYTFAEHSTFENYDISAEIAPGIELNLYPYAESTRRQLRLQYEVGAATAVYRDTTIFGRTAETYPFHELEVKAIFAQPWGSVDVETEFNQFLDRPDKYRLELGGNLSLRLIRGLTLDLGGEAALVRDQINLARAGATDEEVLTEQRELATGYEVFARVGLSYTFGSSFNPVVNVRFD